MVIEHRISGFVASDHHVVLMRGKGVLPNCAEGIQVNTPLNPKAPMAGGAGGRVGGGSQGNTPQCGKGCGTD